MALACSHLAVLTETSHQPAQKPWLPPAAVTCSLKKPLENTLPLPFPTHQRFFLLCPPQSLKPEGNYAFSLINVATFTEIIYISMSFTAVRLLCSLGLLLPCLKCLPAGSRGGQNCAEHSQGWDAEFPELVGSEFLLGLDCTAGRKGAGEQKSQPWCMSRATQHLKHHQQWLGCLPSPCWLFKRLFLFKNSLQDLTQAASC